MAIATKFAYEYDEKGHRLGPNSSPTHIKQAVERSPRSARQLLYVTLGNSRHSKRTIPTGVIRSTDRSTWPVSERAIPSLTWEPVSGFEPLTCRLQEVRPRAPSTLAAAMARVIALMALAALGLSGATFHEPFHADGRQRSMTVTERSDRTHRSGAAT